MILPRLPSLIFGAIVLIVLSSHEIQAQSVSKTQGFFGVQIPGASAEHPQRRTYLGTQLRPAPIYTLPVFQVSGKVIESTFGDFVDPNSGTNPPEKYYLHFVDGDGRGYVADIASFAEDEIHCEEDLPSFIQAGDFFQINRHRRLAEIFTTDNAHGFGSGESADQSDNISIFNPDLQAMELFYFHSVRLRWEKEGLAEDANNHLIRHPYSYYVIRRTPGMIRIILDGLVPEIPLLLPVQTEPILFSLPLGKSLSDLVDQTGTHSAQSGPNSASSDLFTIHEASSNEQRGPFYYSTASNPSKWLKVGDTNNIEPTTLADPLSSVLIHRKGSDGYVRVEYDYFSDPPPSYPTLAANPEPGETATNITLHFDLPPWTHPGTLFSLQMSSDLTNWIEIADEIYLFNGTVTYTLPFPPGQIRHFYRLVVLSE